MKKDSLLNFSHLFIVFFSIILIPLVNHLFSHQLTVEATSLTLFLTLLTFFSPFSSSIFTSLSYSLLGSCFFYIFGPVLLEYTPPTLLAPFVHFPYGHSLYSNLELKSHLSIQVYENITIDQAYEIVAITDSPILFRGLIQNSEEIGETILQRLKDDGKKFLSQRFVTRPYDFFRGSRFEASLSSSIEEVMKSQHNEYIGFEPLLNHSEMISLMGDRKNDKIIADHSFLANFNETIVTTFVHAAPASMSWSLQLTGKKTWFLWHPSLYDHMNMGWFCRVSVPSYGDEALLFSYPSYRVNVEAGDALVFPPMWYHTVVTHAGKNIMVNFRTKCGKWTPNQLIQSVRFFTATILTKWIGQSTPHHQPGIRKIRMNNLQNVFDVAPESLRWDNPEKYTN